jgi:hypothetical protein
MLEPDDTDLARIRLCQESAESPRDNRKQCKTTQGDRCRNANENGRFCLFTQVGETPRFCMACKGSGVQIPSASLSRSPVSNRGSCASGNGVRAASRLCRRRRLIPRREARSTTPNRSEGPWVFGASSDTIACPRPDRPVQSALDEPETHSFNPAVVVVVPIRGGDTRLRPKHTDPPRGM